MNTVIFMNISVKIFFRLQPYKLHRLETGPSTTTTLTSNDALSMYEKLIKMRKLEAAVGSLYKEQEIKGFCHLYTGLIDK